VSVYRDAAYQQRDRERKRAARALSTSEQRAESRAYKLAYDIAHRDERSAKNRAYRIANRDRCIAVVLEWRQRNPGRQAQYNATRRARKNGNGGTHTFAQWLAKCDEFDQRCAYCGEAKSLTRDHRIPISRGGTNDIDNIVPACALCNSRKRAKTEDEFRRLLAA
jgi:5-methylcytosine-specific restriction endonuclease McrA